METAELVVLGVSPLCVRVFVCACARVCMFARVCLDSSDSSRFGRWAREPGSIDPPAEGAALRVGPSMATAECILI